MRLIDSDKLHTDIFVDHIGNMAETETVAAFLLRLEKAPEVHANDFPTIGAEPVRHGEWHECWYTDTVCASICTNCGKAATQARHIVGQELMTNVRYPLCPNCGARMDGGERR